MLLGLVNWLFFPVGFGILSPKYLELMDPFDLLWLWQCF
jgi:hypothetical protein